MNQDKSNNKDKNKNKGNIKVTIRTQGNEAWNENMKTK